MIKHKFQGAGFSIDIPNKCQNITCYTFLLPTDKQFTPYITIQSEKFDHTPNLESIVDEQEKKIQDNSSDYQLVNRIKGKHAGNNATIVTSEWGSGASRICQRKVYLLKNIRNTTRMYTINCTDLASNFAISQPMMNEMIRTIKLDDNQIFN